MGEAKRRSYSSGRTEQEIGFDLDGVSFTPGNLSILDMADLAQYAELDTDTPEGLAKLGEFFALMLGDDYPRFREHCGKHHTRADVLLQIIFDLLEDILAVTMPGFPTPAASPSSAGPPITKPMWKVISPDGTVREEELTPEREAELREAIRQAEIAELEQLAEAG